jgi:hypothetical protein
MKRRVPPQHHFEGWEYWLAMVVILCVGAVILYGFDALYGPEVIVDVMCDPARGVVGLGC